MKERPTRGSIAAGFNAGLGAGVVLFFIALYPLMNGLSGGWRWAGGAAGALLFWIVGVNAVIGAGQAIALGVVAASVAGAWIARWQGAVAWLPPVIVLSGALLGAAAGLWCSTRDEKRTT